MASPMSDQKVLDNLQDVKHIIIVLSGKGGVGKSTVATSLARTLADNGHRVGLLDADIHGPSVPKLLGITQGQLMQSNGQIQPLDVSPQLSVVSISFLLKDADSPVIWRGPMKMGIIKQFLGDIHWGTRDYLIIDLPPGTGDEPLTIAQLLPHADGAVIVTTPQDVALISVRKSIGFVQKLNLPVIGIIENMSGLTCPHCGKTIDVFKTQGGKRIAKEFKVPFLGAIPLDPSIVTSGDAGESLVVEASKKTQQAFQTIIHNIENQVRDSPST